MKISVVGGSEKFVKLLDRVSHGGVCRHANLSCALSDIEKGGVEALFLLPDYDGGKYLLPEFTEDEANRLFAALSGVRAYVENYPAYDYRDCYPLGLQGRSLLNNVGRYTVCLKGRYKDSLGFDILQKRGGFYIPSEKSDNHRKGPRRVGF